MNTDTKSQANQAAKVLMFPRQGAKLLVFPSTPAAVRPVRRDGFGRPITHMFGLRISGSARKQA
jgi:hypothetical protein